MTIDWSKPICLDTVPPRAATLIEGPDEDGDCYVRADWPGRTPTVDDLYVDSDGAVYGLSEYPRVRNIRPGDFEPAPDLAVELAGALRDLVKCNEEWNDSVQKIIGRVPNWTDGYLDAARAALAKYEESRK